VGQNLFADPSRVLGVVQKISLGQQIYVKVLAADQRFDKGAFASLTWAKEKIAF